ncbi:hypothetical protein DBR44_06485 [Aquitalea sp. FJL05]|uniref:methyl-accepting chemotaxis protein n=1 Tax=Aquitalea sp. FJL05 TaxID=2153366 RepID=UPI000F5A9495|nr:methyl-accepting chemotaxis protein [Aquitalea sp. FJL05]RQO76314.1 hypothetical protein DBR44_06485 [Aquitalea sp. FJL05]
MTVAQRILLQIGLALAAILVISGFSIYTQNSLADTARNFSNSDYPSIITLAKFEKSALRLRLSVTQYLISENQNEKDATRDLFEKRYKIAQDSIADYEKFINSDEDRHDFNDDKVKLNSYYESAKPLFAAFDQGNLALAKKIRVEQVIPKADDLLKNIEKHIEYNQKYVAEEVIKSEKEAANAKTVTLITLILTVIILAASGYRTFNAVTKPLNELKNAMSEIQASLDFTKKVTVHHPHDEVGTTATAFNKLIEGINGSLRQIATTCKEVTDYTGKLTLAANHVSQAASHQNEASASIAATMEELTVSINHVGTRAGTTSEKTIEANALAGTGQVVIGKTVQDIRSIHTTVNQATQRINQLEQENSKVAAAVGSIKDIAEQTNLLALNAAIEAARAGEQGRGFAVVADEVRKLAERTTTLTSEIDSVIRSITETSRQSAVAMADTQKLVDAGVHGADDALQSIEQIGHASSNAKELVTEITEAIREQATASTTIAVQVEQIAQMAERSSDAAKETATTADKLDQAVASMTEAVHRYRL